MTDNDAARGGRGPARGPRREAAGRTGGPRGEGDRRDRAERASTGRSGARARGRRPTESAGRRRRYPAGWRAARLGSPATTHATTAAGSAYRREDRPRGGRDRAGEFDNSERRGGSMLTPKSPRLPEPAILAEVTGKELDRDVRGQLRTLSVENADGVAKHLVMVAIRLAEDDLEAALAHAETAVRRAGRVPGRSRGARARWPIAWGTTRVRSASSGPCGGSAGPHTSSPSWWTASVDSVAPSGRSSWRRARRPRPWASPSASS